MKSATFALNIRIIKTSAELTFAMRELRNDYTAPHVTSNPVRTGSITWIFFCTAIIWIFYTILMFYVFYEHQQRRQYPQNLIIFLLALGSLCRCIWFGFYVDYGETVLFQVLNRIAILLQFSAISLLLLMWSRALKVSSIVDRAAYGNVSSVARLRGEQSGNDNPENDIYITNVMVNESLQNIVTDIKQAQTKFEADAGDKMAEEEEEDIREPSISTIKKLNSAKIFQFHLSLKRYTWLGKFMCVYKLVDKNVYIYMYTCI